MLTLATTNFQWIPEDDEPNTCPIKMFYKSQQAGLVCYTGIRKSNDSFRLPYRSCCATKLTELGKLSEMITVQRMLFLKKVFYLAMPDATFRFIFLFVTSKTIAKR